MFLHSCNSPVTKKNNDRIVPAPSWLKAPVEQWPQILLTNRFYFTGYGGSYGASAFLVNIHNDTVVCTARHLLGPNMGLPKAIPPDSVDLLMEEWVVFPRNNVVPDTLSVTGLHPASPRDKDLLLLQVSPSPSYEVLQVRWEKPAEGEHFRIIGCEYADETCNQKTFRCTYTGITMGLYGMEAETPFAVSGFSGAPVIDEKGRAVGLLSGGEENNGKLHLYIEPFAP